MKVGEEIKIRTKKKIETDEFLKIKSVVTAKIYQLCENFLVVEYKEGYKECFQYQDIVDGIIIKR